MSFQRNKYGCLNLDGFEDVEDFQKKGFYFRPASHSCKNYLVEVEKKEDGSNCLVVVHEIGIPYIGGVGEVSIEQGDMIATMEYEYLLEIHLWGKYFFPSFNAKSYQWYYDSDHGYPSDDIMAVAEVMKFAVAKGLEVAGITPY